MQNVIQKFRQNSIVFEKPGILSKKLKTLTSSNYHRVQDFLPKTPHTFPTYQCLQKSVRDFFLFCLYLELFAKIKKDLDFTHSFFYTFINKSRSKQNKTNPAHHLVDITKQKICAKFQQKILNSIIVGARQSFQFFRQKTWFLGNNRSLP